MPTLDEMSQWTPAQVEAEVRSALPPEFTFEHKFESDVGWCGYIRDGDETVVWQYIGAIDPKLSLFGAYGWLRYRDAKPRHPAWVRSSREMPSPRTGRMTAPGLPDVPTPEDVEPEFVQSVYFGDPDKRR